MGDFYHGMGDVVASIQTKPGRGEFAHRGIGKARIPSGDIKQGINVAARGVGAELHLFPYPLGAFAGNRFLGKLIAKFDLKFRAVKTSLTVQAGDVKFTFFFWSFFFDKSGGREDEAQLLYAFKLFVQGLICVDRKAGGSNRKAASFFDGNFQIRFDYFVDVIEYLHAITSTLCIASGFPKGYFIKDKGKRKPPVITAGEAVWAPPVNKQSCGLIMKNYLPAVIVRKQGFHMHRRGIMHAFQL